MQLTDENDEYNPAVQATIDSFDPSPSMTRKFAALRDLNWEFVLLLGLILVLPSLEAPKNIFWIFYVAAWLFNRVRRGEYGGPWDGWDTLILAWITSSYFIAFFAGQPNDEWDGAADVLRYASLLWLIKRSGYSAAQLNILIRTIVVATLFSLAWGTWAWLGAKTVKTLELNSVGHVNHSAIFMVIVFGAAVSSLLASLRQNRYWILLGMAAVIGLGTAVFISSSRAAVLAMLLLCVALGLAWLRRSRWVLVILLLIAGASASTAYLAKIEVVKKQQANAAQNNVLSYRDGIWNTALVAWRKYPWFGVGMHNFDQISAEETRAWAEASGRPYTSDSYVNSAHAHSLYLSALAERGILGTAVLGLVVLAWAATLWRGMPAGPDPYIAWALWGGAFSAWFVTVVVGVVNTTLHHEQGMLAMLLLGAFLCYRNTRPAVA